MPRSNRIRILLIAAGIALAVALLAGWILANRSNRPEVALVASSQVTPSPTATRAEATATRAASPVATSTITPTRAPDIAVARTPGPTVSPDLALEYAVVKPNEYLGTVARRYGVAVDEIVALSAIENPDSVAIGQGLIIPHRVELITPDEVLIPDSELTYGPAYVGFDLREYIEEQGGYLSQFNMLGLNGERWDGADVIERIALRYSVGPRVLLALMEARSGWVTNPDPQGIARDYPLGHTNGAPGLLPQLEWAANELNHGFYGWMDRGETAVRFEDGAIARGAPGLNPGTVAVQWALAEDRSFSDLEEEMQAFAGAYRRLFGDPAGWDAGPVLPAGLEQPELAFPWAAGEWWHLTGGPHGAWISTSGWAALDFVPEDAPIGTCIPAQSWARAAADGVVARNDGGEVLLDLDGDGDVRTGWVLQYLHTTDRVVEGSKLKQGDPIGRPACEGGAAVTTHLHFARRYNGLWVAAGGPVPMVLDGWTAHGGFEYDGTMTKPRMPPREASHSRERAVNGLRWEE